MSYNNIIPWYVLEDMRMEEKLSPADYLAWLKEQAEETHHPYWRMRVEVVEK